jgi:hypothetical protein
MRENITDVHVPEGSLNIPRAKMPQIRSDLVPEFVDELAASGVRVDRMKRVGVSRLKPTQKEINNDKVRKMLTAPPTVLAKPVIVSKDFYILDGHHRWLALLNSKPDFKIQTYFVHLPIRQLLKRANSFGKVSYKSIVERIDALLHEGKSVLPGFEKYGPDRVADWDILNRDLQRYLKDLRGGTMEEQELADYLDELHQVARSRLRRVSKRFSGRQLDKYTRAVAAFEPKAMLDLRLLNSREYTQLMSLARAVSEL